MGKLFSIIAFVAVLGTQCFADQAKTSPQVAPISTTLNLSVPKEPIEETEDGYEDFQSTRFRTRDCEGTTVLTRISQFAKEVARELDKDTRPDENARIRPIVNEKATEGIEGVKPIKIQGGFRIQFKLQE